MIYRAFLIFSLVITINLPSAVAATRELILIKASGLIDVRTGELLTDQAILIDGDKIAKVGPSARLGQHGSDPVRVVDLTGFTVLPGLIDCHAHVLGNLSDLSAFGPLRMSSPQGAL
jgi:imidazolonepropionase-like amidohydrolase